MPEADPLQRWLDDYRRGVDETLSRSEPPASPLARDAQEAFQNWWRAEQDDLLSPQAAASRLAEPSLPPSDEDHLLPPDWPAQIERLAYEKADAERRLSAARSETEALERRLGELEKASAEAKAQASRERAELEARLEAVDAKLAAAGERESTLREARDLMQESAMRLARELERLQKDLELEREKGQLGARQGAALAKQVEELEKERARLRETLAGQDGALQELRKQAAGYQARLIESKELTDADIALMRQDLKLFMEELKIIRNTIKKGE